MPSKTGSSGPPKGEIRDYAALQGEVTQLRGIVEEMVRAHGLECILEHGFEELAKRLEPLAAIAPARSKLDDVAIQKLRALRDSHIRPDYSTVPPPSPRNEDDYGRQGARPAEFVSEVVEMSLESGTTPTGRSAP